VEEGFNIAAKRGAERLPNSKRIAAARCPAVLMIFGKQPDAFASR